MDSVHNAIQKGAEQMVDNMISTLTGVPVSGKNTKSKKERKNAVVVKNDKK